MLEDLVTRIKKRSSSLSSSGLHQPLCCVGATIQRAWEDVGIPLMCSDLWPAAPAAAQVSDGTRLRWWSFGALQLSDARVQQAWLVKGGLKVRSGKPGGFRITINFIWSRLCWDSLSNKEDRVGTNVIPINCEGLCWQGGDARTWAMCTNVRRSHVQVDS